MPSEKLKKEIKIVYFSALSLFILFCMQNKWSSTIEGSDELCKNNHQIGHLLFESEEEFPSHSQDKDDQFYHSFLMDEFDGCYADRFGNIQVEEESEVQVFSQSTKNIDTPYQERLPKQDIDEVLLMKNIENDQTQKSETPVQEFVPFEKVESIENLVFVEDNQYESQNKNTNLLKFLIKAFFKEIQIGLDYYDPEWKAYNEKLRSEIFENGQEKITRNGLALLFGASLWERSPYQKKNRLFMMKLLREDNFRDKNIFGSNYIKKKNKKQFLLGSKIFSLRCRSATLTARLESR